MARKPSRFSDFQLDRMRDALRAYHKFSRDSEGVYATLKAIEVAIHVETNVPIPQENLRRFIYGIEDKKTGIWKPTEPKDPKHLDAIEKFVLEEELISEDELREYIPERQASLRLIEYLYQGISWTRNLPAGTLDGRYLMYKNDDYAFVIHDLTFQRSLETGLIQVIETETKYAKEAFLQFQYSLPFLTETHEPRSRTQYGGWAIITPEDNLLIFLKKESDGANRFYFAINSQMRLGEEPKQLTLGLMHHNFPLGEAENDNKHDFIKQVASEAQSNIHIFQRQEEQGPNRDQRG